MLENSDQDKQARTWAMLCHLTAFAGYIFPLGNILGPLIVWLLKRKESPLVADQGKEALNFQISITLYYLMAAFFIIMLVWPTFATDSPNPGPMGGIVLLLLVMLGLTIFNVIVVIIGAVKASSGERFRYPLAIRFIS